MRSVAYLVVGCVACGGEDTRGPFPPVPVDEQPPISGTDAGTPDAGQPPDASPMPITFFESATISPGPHDVVPAWSADDWQPVVGVLLTTSKPYTITGLGAHIRRACEACEASTMVMAIVPLDPTTNLPRTIDLSDAIGSGTAEVPHWPSTTLDEAPPSTVFPASFELPAGTWGLVVGSNRLGVPQVIADLPLDVEGVGTNRYFVYSTDQTRWLHSQVDAPDVRLFAIGY
jgi:hypothetical protein